MASLRTQDEEFKAAGRLNLELLELIHTALVEFLKLLKLYLNTGTESHLPAVKAIGLKALPGLEIIEEPLNCGSPRVETSELIIHRLARCIEIRESFHNLMSDLRDRHSRLSK
ncbi:hypothetical protein K3495_g9160 [Podosphaera aphanis]|nr:hypothetical protein K3495_g9160 [Podosphaera aphanis]